MKIHKVADDSRTHYLTPIQRDPCHHDTECGSYWAKIPMGVSKPEPVEADQLDDVTQTLPQPLLQPKFSMANSTATEMEGSVVRELCKISSGPYACRLNPMCTLEELDAGDHNSPKLPPLQFGPPVIQFNYKNPNLTKGQLAIIGECTWALLKRDAEIMSECREQFKEEIAQETRACYTKTKEEIEGGAVLMGQLHPSNIITALTVHKK